MDAAVGCEVNFVLALHLLWACALGCGSGRGRGCVCNCVCLPLHSTAPNTNTNAVYIRAAAACMQHQLMILFFSQTKYVIRSVNSRALSSQWTFHCWHILVIQFRNVPAFQETKKIACCDVLRYAMQILVCQSISELSQAATTRCYTGTQLTASDGWPEIINTFFAKKCDMLCAMTGKYFTCTTSIIQCVRLSNTCTHQYIEGISEILAWYWHQMTD